MMTYDLGCTYSGGPDLKSTLNDAGLAFLSPSQSQQSVQRQGSVFNLLLHIGIVLLKAALSHILGPSDQQGEL